MSAIRSRNCILNKKSIIAIEIYQVTIKNDSENEYNIFFYFLNFSKHM